MASIVVFLGLVIGLGGLGLGLVLGAMLRRRGVRRAWVRMLGVTVLGPLILAYLAVRIVFAGPAGVAPSAEEQRTIWAVMAGIALILSLPVPHLWHGWRSWRGRGRR